MIVDDAARCVTAGYAQRLDWETENFVAHTLLAKENDSHAADLDTYVAHSLRAEGFDASEDGTGRGTPLVPVSVAIRGRDEGGAIEMGDDVAHALRASQGGGDKPHVLAPVAYSIMPQNSGKDYKARRVEVAQPLMAGGPVGGNQGGDYIVNPIAFNSREDPEVTFDRCGPLGSSSPQAQAIAFDTTQITSKGNYSHPKAGDPCHPLAAGAHPLAIATQWAVRRLTHTECARLQGFDDNHCRIPWRGKPVEQCPDGPQYKAYGNSMSTNVMRWLGERIEVVDQIEFQEAAE